MEAARILVVEDEAIIALDLATRLRKMGHQVVATAASGEQALARARELQPELVLMDVMLQGEMNGIQTAARLREVSDVPVVYLTSHSDPATLRSAISTTEPFGYLLKPYNERELLASIQVALYRHRTEAKMRKLERWLSATMSSIGDAVIATDVQGLVTLINPVAQRLTGWDEAQALGRPFHEVFNVIDGASREPIDDLVERALTRGFDIGLSEHVILQGRNANALPIDDSIAPIRDENGIVTGVVIVFRDGTERVFAEQAMHAMQQQLEQRVKTRTAQLEAANRALEAFTFSVSHDMRAPLRAVNGFSTLLAERYGDVLDAQGKHFLEIIRNKSAEMGRMIDDFLRLFRVRHEALHIGPLDVAEMVGSVVADLAVHQPHTAGIVVETLPAVSGDAALMRIVWVNLIGNAIKFTSRTEQPSIRVSGQEVGDKVVFRVVDNGAGFDMAQQDRLFSMFERLHPESDFHGNGIGLTIVSAVVERHHGSVRATGVPGQGATFEFCWPKLPPAE